ncbi:MAG TPA: branched-chain amino acid ABC transporter permease [Streptosporangiaceae bacterium]|jgi:branched-chain amino acid transport system permease protein
MSAVGHRVPQVAAAAEPAAVRVTRSRRSGLWPALVVIAAVAVLGYLPYLVLESTTNLMVQFFWLLTMASMWNLLAGYAGLVSVGQQAFVGLGMYFVLIAAQHNIDPFVAIPIATLGTAVVGVPVWWLVSRLRSGYFAIATWVVASVCNLIIIRYPSLGGGTGATLPNLPSISDTLLNADIYWVALGVTVVALGGIYLLLRSRLGLVLTAIRDDETGARSVGGRVGRTQRLVFIVAAAGCGAAGAFYVINQLGVQPSAAFSVQLSAEMIFITVIGGIGTIEGPIVGTVVFFALQQWLSQDGTWYWIILGLVAITVAIWAPRGLWGLVRIRLFPTGYWVWPPGTGPGLLGFSGRSASAAKGMPAAEGAAGPASGSAAGAAGPDRVPEIP